MKRTIVLISSIVIALMISLPVYAMEILGGAGAGASTGNSYSVSGSATKQEVQAKQSISCKVPLTDIGDASKKIKDGVYVGTINISGMTQEEALNAVNNYVAELSGTEIGLICVSGNTVNVHAYDLGLTWTDTGIIDDAISLGRSGNVIKRFKEIADLKRSNKVYELKLNADEEKIRQVITDECKKYDVEAKNSTMTRENGEFKVTPGHDGLTVNVDESVKLVTEKLMSISSASPLVVSLILDESKPKGDADTLGKLTDVLGTFTTKFTNSGKDRVTNVSNGCRLVNGTL
nr:peptidoglycan binding domain-containing protein [Lachnospiraceae bacterium]